MAPRALSYGAAPCGTSASALYSADSEGTQKYDQEGNLYVAEVFNGRVRKFRPKANADPTTLVGQEHRYSAAGTK